MQLRNRRQNEQKINDSRGFSPDCYTKFWGEMSFRYWGQSPGVSLSEGQPTRRWPTVCVCVMLPSCSAPVQEIGDMKGLHWASPGYTQHSGADKQIRSDPSLPPTDPHVSSHQSLLLDGSLVKWAQCLKMQRWSTSGWSMLSSQGRRMLSDMFREVDGCEILPPNLVIPDSFQHRFYSDVL